MRVKLTPRGAAWQAPRTALDPRPGDHNLRGQSMCCQTGQFDLLAAAPALAGARTSQGRAPCPARTPGSSWIPSLQRSWCLSPLPGDCPHFPSVTTAVATATTVTVTACAVAVLATVMATPDALAFGRRQLAPALAQLFTALRRQGPETAIGITHTFALFGAQLPEALPAVEAPLALFRWQGPEPVPAFARLCPLLGRHGRPPLGTAGHGLLAAGWQPVPVVREPRQELLLLRGHLAPPHAGRRGLVGPHASRRQQQQQGKIPKVCPDHRCPRPQAAPLWSLDRRGSADHAIAGNRRNPRLHPRCRGIRGTRRQVAAQPRPHARPPVRTRQPAASHADSWSQPFSPVAEATAQA